jgi:hypothetical protein
MGTVRVAWYPAGPREVAQDGYFQGGPDTQLVPKNEFKMGTVRVALVPS